MNDDVLLRTAMTAGDRLDDLTRARMWAQLDKRLAAEPAPRSARRRWVPILALAAGVLGIAVVAIGLARGGGTAPTTSLVAPAQTTLATALGPHTRAALVGPAAIDLVGEPGEATTVRLRGGTLLAEFTGGAGRSLRVEAPGLTVDIVGTLFSVEVRGTSSCVAVAHGRVRATRGDRVHEVSGGQELCSGDADEVHAIEPARQEALAQHEAVIAAGAAVAVPQVAAVAVPQAVAVAVPQVATVTAPQVAAAREVQAEPPPPPPPPSSTTPLQVAIAPPHAAPAPQQLTPRPPSAPTPPPPLAPARNASPAQALPPRSPASPPRIAPSSTPPPPLTPAPTPTPTPPEPLPAPRTPPPAPPPRPAAPPPAPPVRPTADDHYRAAEEALARRDPAAADRALAELLADAPTSPLVDQALYERARIAYGRHAWSEARRHLDALASRPVTALSEPGRYLSCRIALDVRDGDAARCITDYRAAYPGAPHDLELLVALVGLQHASDGCAQARAAIAELVRRYPTSPAASAWSARCPAAPGAP